MIFTRNGMGDGPADLQVSLVSKFLQLTLENDVLPAKMLFYTDGVRLACKGSAVLQLLQQLAEMNVELILCSTCLQRYGLMEDVEVGITGSMADIIEAISKAEKVVSL